MDRLVAVECDYERRDLCSPDGGFLFAVVCLRALLRSTSLGMETMDLESIIMLIVTACMGAYLLYALLRPERF